MYNLVDHNLANHNLANHNPMALAPVEMGGQLGAALLVDAENIGVNHIGLVIAHLQAQTPVGLKRAYGDWFEERLKGWRSVLATQEIEPVHVLPTASGKNAADIRLVIDAMELLYVRKIQQFCIVSSDRDFTPLVRSLKQAGATVIGYGRQNAAEIFKNAYHRFYVLEELANPTLVSSGSEHHTQPLLQVISGNASGKLAANGATQDQAANQAANQATTVKPWTATELDATLRQPIEPLISQVSSQSTQPSIQSVAHQSTHRAIDQSMPAFTSSLDSQPISLSAQQPTVQFTIHLTQPPPQQAAQPSPQQLAQQQQAQKQQAQKQQAQKQQAQKQTQSAQPQTQPEAQQQGKQQDKQQGTSQQSGQFSAKPHAKQLQKMLQTIYTELATNHGWITGGQLLTGLQKHCRESLNQGFSCKLFGYSNFNQILSGINLFEFDPNQKANTPLSERKLRIRLAA
ncbi:MAG: NYN domain-containing protein [Elainella sp. Prado103]|jgi:hypothetical protein|nr:NYN domain-containing protein [Elainella sp. Prado103]